jgi:hypothetical protein
VPAKSKKQEKFMQAVAKNPAFAKKVGVPQSVGKEFTMKKTKKYPTGGQVGTGGNAQPMTRAARFTQRATGMNTKVASRVADMTAKKATMPTARQAQFQSNIDKYRTKGTERVARLTAKATAANTAGRAMGGPLVNRQPKEKKMAKGGQLSKANGIATKGKTHTKMVKMAKKGGSC